MYIFILYAEFEDSEPFVIGYYGSMELAQKELESGEWQELHGLTIVTQFVKIS